MYVYITYNEKKESNILGHLLLIIIIFWTVCSVNMVLLIMDFIIYGRNCCQNRADLPTWGIGLRLALVAQMLLFWIMDGSNWSETKLMKWSSLALEKIKIGCTMRCSKIEICYNRELLMISQKSWGPCTSFCGPCTWPLHLFSWPLHLENCSFSAV